MKNDTTLSVKIHDLLESQGFQTHTKGYKYVKLAIEMCFNDRKYLSAWTKSLYPDIAKIYDDTASRVERALRYSIEVAGLNTTISKFISKMVYKLEVM